MCFCYEIALINGTCGDLQKNGTRVIFLHVMLQAKCQFRQNGQK